MSNQCKRVSARNVLRAPMRYYGGKGHLVSKILPYIEKKDYQIYVEPFCGAASIFFAKTPHPVEVINDIDSAVIDLFSQIKSGDDKLFHMIYHTPYSKYFFANSIDVENSTFQNPGYCVFVKNNLGISGHMKRETNWSVGRIVRRGISSNINSSWMRMFFLSSWRERLKDVIILRQDALDVIKRYDSTSTLFYLDPPYYHPTRNKQSVDVYAHELDDEFYHKFVDLLCNLKGSVVLSCYMHPIFEPLLKSGYQVVEFNVVSCVCRSQEMKTLGTGVLKEKSSRTECLLICYQ